MKWGLPIILFVGLVIRFILIPNPGFEADVAFWKSWSLAASDHGIVWMTANTNNNYPPAFGYILWAMGKTYAFLANPHDFKPYWDSSNFLFLFVSKMIPIISDALIALGIYWLLSHPYLFGISVKDKKDQEDKMMRHLSISLPTLGAAMYFLHPVPILDGAWWGQIDAFGVVFLLFSLLFLFKDQPGRAIFIIVFGFLLKLQNIIYIPIIFLYIFRRNGVNGISRGLLGGFLAWILGVLPFLLSKKVDTAFYLLGANADWFPWLSLHAYNIWWILSGGNGMGFSDKFLLWGVLSPKVIGLILFACSYLVSVLVVLLKPQPKQLLVSLFLVVFSFFILLTQSHERYIFPAFIFFPLLLPFFWEDNRLIARPPKPWRRWGLLGYWVILSLTATFNIHRTLLINYSHNGLPLLSAFQSVPLTIIASYINILLYLISLTYTAFLGGIWILPLIVSLAAIGLFFTNKEYLISGKVPLTKLKMVGWYQEFAAPQLNRSVSSSSGPKSWNRLSSLYFFYPKGIGTHAKSELVYELRGKFRRLRSDFGVDTEAGTRATVVFQVIGDKKILFTSQPMGRFDLPGSLDIDISGINELKLVALPTDDGNYDDHADWLNPILYK